MPEVVRFIPDYQMDVPTQAVYLKSAWADAWVAVPELWCSEATWSVAPTIPTASLRHRYGDALESTVGAFAVRAPLRDQGRVYVRVDFNVNQTDSTDTSELTRSFYGVIEVELDEQHGPILEDDGQGNVTAYPTGRNHLIAYGLESILARSYIDRSYVGAQLQKVDRALPFNPGLAEVAFDPDTVVTPREGNRSPDLGPDGVYVFHDRRSGGKIWSSLDAANYLVCYCTERDKNDEIVVPFLLVDADGTLPNWDQPIEACEGETVYELLNRFIARQRCLAWCVRVTAGDQGADTVEIVPCTFLAEDLSLSESKVLRANTNQKKLAWESDRGAMPAIKRSELDRVDQIIARGERRTSTATFSFIDGTLTIGWPADLETEFETAASTAADYPAAAKVAQRQLFDDAYRSADRLKPVYSRFVPADPMSTSVGDGTSGSAFQVLMPSDADEDSPTPHAPEDQRFLPHLPLLEGYNYDGDAIDSGNPADDGAKPARRLKPLVFLKRKNLDPADVTVRWQHAEASDLEAARETDSPLNLSARVRVDNEDGALWITVENGYAYDIASADFTPLATDFPSLGLNFRTDLIATLAVPWSQFAEAKYPETPPAGDGVRRQIIDVPNRRLDYVVPNTVVAIDASGGLLRTDTGGYVRDDRDELKDAARIAFAWYGQTRKAVSFTTSLVNNHVELGDLIVSIGDPNYGGDNATEDVNSIVTQIRIAMPLAEGEGNVEPPIPTIEYETGFGELDALKLLPRAFKS